MSTEQENTYRADSASVRGHARTAWPPAWLKTAGPTPSEADAERAEERAAIEAEADGTEPIRFEPAEPTTPPTLLDDWIERRGADGRIGFDRPGVPVASRWWERAAYGELPSWP